MAACSDPFRFHGDVSQTAASISTSELWKRINQRLGTEVTRYLLQDCAIFATVPPSCLLQVCGEPVYDLLLPRAWSGFFLGHGATQTSSGVTRKTPVAVARKKLERVVTRKRARDEDLDDIRKYRPVLKKRRMAENDSSLNVRNPESHGSRSWKPADQPPPRPSRCSIRVLNMLYGGRGLKGFLLNRKLKAGVGGARRLQGADLVRIISSNPTCLTDRPSLGSFPSVSSQWFPCSLGSCGSTGSARTLSSCAGSARGIQRRRIWSRC